MLDPARTYSLFTVVGIARQEPLAPISEEVGYSAQKCTGCESMRGDKFKPGAQEGIDSQKWGAGREYLVYIRYELHPLPVQAGESGPMRELREMRTLTLPTA